MTTTNNNLHTRIEKILDEKILLSGKEFRSLIATTIIEELNLVPEYSEGDDETRVLWDTEEETPHYISPDKIQIRYVTPWKFLKNAE